MYIQNVELLILIISCVTYMFWTKLWIWILIIFQHHKIQWSENWNKITINY